MMKLSQISCVYNNYYGVVNYYSTSTAWTDSAVTAGSNNISAVRGGFPHFFY